MPLTAKDVEHATPKNKTYRLTDGRGLYLEVRPNGSKYWRYKFRFEGKEKLLALGVYPRVKLIEARHLHHDAWLKVRNGINPIEEKRVAATKTTGPTFEAVANEWLEKQQQWKENHRRTVVGRLNNDVLPALGKRMISELQPIDVLNMLKKIEARGAHATAIKVKGICSQIFRYAVSSCIITSDITRDLAGALTTPERKHFAAITTVNEAGALMRAIRGLNGFAITKHALLLTAYTFPRQGELRHAEWPEVDFKNKRWVIPSIKTKMKRDHLVPLSRQALTVLEELHDITSEGKYLFPSLRTPEKPMSENTCNAALRRLGYTSSEMTAHGFRSMASTLLNEHGYNPDVIELQLAHVERNKVRAAYNRALHLEERCKLMQDWADMLDKWETNNR